MCNDTGALFAYVLCDRVAFTISGGKKRKLDIIYSNSLQNRKYCKVQATCSRNSTCIIPPLTYPTSRQRNHSSRRRLCYNPPIEQTTPEHLLPWWYSSCMSLIKDLETHKFIWDQRRFWAFWVSSRQRCERKTWVVKPRVMTCWFDSWIIQTRRREEIGQITARNLNIAFTGPRSILKSCQRSP